MIRNLTNSIDNLLTGPISKPLIADNHDYMGNSLGPSVFFIDDFASNVIFSTLYFSSAALPFTLNTGFSLGGQSYSMEAASVTYANIVGGQGNYTYITIQAVNTSGGTALADLVVGQTLGETLGIRYSGSGGTYDYYPLVLGSGSDFEWFGTGSNTAIINLKVESGGTFAPWVSGSTAFGPTMGIGNNDALSITWLE